MNGKTVKGYVFAIVSAVIFGCMPLMSSYIYADGVNPMSLVFLRNLFSLPALAVLAYLESRTLKVPPKQLPAIAAVSILGCCITPILLFSSYRHMASGTATVFHFIYPAVVVMAEILFFHKPAKTANIISVVMCVLGVGLFYTPGEPLSLTGSVLALTSGVTFASYVIALSAFRDSRISGFLFCFYVTAFSAAAAFLICIVSGNLTLPVSLLGWGMCLVFSLLVTTGAVALFQKSAFLIGSQRTSILSTLEPITSVVLGVVVFHEPFHGRVLLGSVLVIAASAVIAAADLRRSNGE